MAQAQEHGGPLSRMDGNREWVSLIACICADGTALTPAVILTGNQVGAGWRDELDEDEKAFVAVSEKGWTSEELGLRWLEDVFEPETEGQRRRLLGRSQQSCQHYVHQ